MLLLKNLKVNILPIKIWPSLHALPLQYTINVFLILIRQESRIVKPSYTVPEPKLVFRLFYVKTSNRVIFYRFYEIYRDSFVFEE